MDDLSSIHIPLSASEGNDYADLDYIPESELDDDDDEYAPDDDFDSPRARFRAATMEMEKRHFKFAEPQALYDFLYEFRDVIGLVTEDYTTILHVAIRFVKDNHSARSRNMMPLIQSIVKDHPMLLRQRDSDGMTPLYIAICTRKPLLVEGILSCCAQDPECESAVQDSIEIPCVRQNGKTCLHIAFELAIRQKSVIQLIKIARDEALALQDYDGRTPLHYAVNCRTPSMDAARLFIQRDGEMLKKIESKGNTDSVETFLDVIDRSGNSIYRHHLAMRERSRDMLQQRETRHPTATGVFQKTNKRRTLLSTDDPWEIPAVAREWDDILRELKLHYLRTRNATRAVSFLYGSNLDDIELQLHLHGLPSNVEATSLLDLLSSVKLGETLQYVSLPDIQVDFTRRFPLMSHNNTKKSGKARWDLQIIFGYLGAQGVRHIIRVDVDDSKEFPHSDEAILKSFGMITVEVFNWKKVDLDPRVICNLGSKVAREEVESVVPKTCHSQLREVTLSWSGNNTTLRAWSEPEGLPLLPLLRKIIILVPSEEEIAESPDWVSACLEEFRRRMGRNASTKADSSVVEEGDNDDTSKTKDSSSSESGRKPIEIHFVQSRENGQDPENLNTLGRPRLNVESRAGYRWLDTVYGFADMIKKSWDHPDMRKYTANDVVVALIDDGVDVYGSPVSANIIGGKSFALDKTKNMPSPYFISELGHGTAMAEALKRACPLVKIYPIRVNIDGGSESGQSSVEARSVALAIETAINRNANIILIASPVEVANSSPQDRAYLEDMLQKANERDIPFFIPSDSNAESQSSYIFSSNVAFRIGEASVDGGAAGRSDSPPDADFIFPGREVVAQHNVESPLHPSDRIQDLNSASININVSLAAGLAATLIYAFQLVRLKSTAGTPPPIGSETSHQDELEHLAKLQRHDGMMKAFQHLGSVTESRFLKVWEALDPIVDEMKHLTVEDQELKLLSHWFSQLRYTEDR
ncbi:intracellular serine protease [Fusarium mundagurra]|uniref:Intracellular serine protease n=1 Tax=Fusarium mundagurra TaxID=1567541 RepID=A0A8H6D4J3_9HYPO|nr:intracellular serine protease [Fusarium mundagurra]